MTRYCIHKILLRDFPEVHLYIYICIYICICIYMYIYIYNLQFPLKTPWVRNFDFVLLLIEKSKIPFSANLIKISKNKVFRVWFQMCLRQVMLTAQLFGGRQRLVVSITSPENKSTKTATLHFYGDFMRFAENVILNFSTRSRKDSKKRTHEVLSANFHRS